MWSLRKPPKDPRSGRLVFLIECLMNQNARDLGAAETPAVSPALIEMLTEADIGMAQIPCPEIACLGFARARPPEQSIRAALRAPAATQRCRRLADETAMRIEAYAAQGYEIVAVLGGNAQSPACAVHKVEKTACDLLPSAGVFALALSRALWQRGLTIPFHGMRDADKDSLAADLDWLRERLAGSR